VSRIARPISGSPSRIRKVASATSKAEALALLRPWSDHLQAQAGRVDPALTLHGLSAEDLSVVRATDADTAGVRAAACRDGRRTRRCEAERIRQLLAVWEG
jgi:hypothetical protein